MLTETEPVTRSLNSSTPDAPAQSDPIACIELDRFCEQCSYNLRTLPIHRDERTGIPIVRCTECGRYQSANDAATALRPWAHRATSLVICVWVLTMIAAFVWLGVAEAAVSYATLDELTHREGTQVQRIGTVTYRTGRGTGPLVVWADRPDHNLFVGAVLFGSAGIAFVVGFLAAVLCPHWPRAARVALALAMPLVAGAVILMTWRYEAPHLINWSLPYISAHVGAQLLGGLIGVTYGRALARMTVRIFLPPTLRPRLAYLWLTDGKALPTPATVPSRYPPHP